MVRRAKKTSRNAVPVAPAIPRPLEIITYARSAAVRRWIEAEHSGHLGTVTHAANVKDAITAMSRVGGSIRSVLIVDADDVREHDLLDLEAFLVKGWGGVVVAIGRVSPRLKRRIGVALVIKRPLGSEALRTVLSDLERHAT